MIGGNQRRLLVPASPLGNDWRRTSITTGMRILTGLNCSLLSWIAHYNILYRALHRPASGNRTCAQHPAMTGSPDVAERVIATSYVGDDVLGSDRRQLGLLITSHHSCDHIYFQWRKTADEGCGSGFCAWKHATGLGKICKASISHKNETSSYQKYDSSTEKSSTQRTGNFF